MERDSANDQETTLEMVQRHVTQGRANIAQQKSLIAKLRADGLPTEIAESILANFDALQLQHESHLARLQGDHR